LCVAARQREKRHSFQWKSTAFPRRKKGVNGKIKISNLLLNTYDINEYELIPPKQSTRNFPLKFWNLFGGN
jgi:hypothetical protein